MRRFPHTRDLGLAAIIVAVIVLAALVPATPEAQSGRFDPAGTYAINVDGSPGVLSLRYNVTPGQPTQPQVPSGSLEQTGIFLSPNNCVPEEHSVAAGHGVWRVVPRTNGRQVQGRSLHAVTDPAGRALGFMFEQIEWQFPVASLAGDRFVALMSIAYFDSMQNLRNGLPACVGHSLDMQGWATFPSS